MHATSAASASARLQRLAGFLAQDPQNPHLLAEACDTALACGRHDQADAFIAAAERLAPDAADWQWRRAQLCIARRELPQARALLEQLLVRSGEHPALVHDLAYVHLLTGDAAAARVLLQPWSRDGFGLPRSPRELLQALWLRACHHLGRMEDAWEWTQRTQASRALEPAAAGVASLVALDLDETETARTLADQALSADENQPEALVTRGCLALAARHAAEAVGFLQRAQERLPGDGRVCCALGFAHLLAGDAAAAREPLEEALQAMPDHVDAWQALGWARLMARDAEGAREAFRTAVELDDQAADSHACLALVLLLVGDREGAQRSLACAQLCDPHDAIAALVRGLMAGAAGRKDVQRQLERLLGQWSPRA